MAELKQTPGKWEAICDGSYVCPEGNSGQFLAIVSAYAGGAPRPVAERMANARLMAAAPDFFAAAQSLLEAWDARTATVAEQIVTGKSDRDLQKQAMGAIEDLRAAIAKATGAA